MSPAKKTSSRKKASRTVTTRANATVVPPGGAGEVIFRELSREEIEEMLLRNKVGRLAFSFHDRVDIQPIHYVYERGWLYGRTSEGQKIASLAHNQWVAFEIDEVSDVFDWRSIVIHGSFWVMH